MAAETIGRCRCPLCSSTKARLSLAKSQLVVLTCNGCNFQAFARSDSSDRLLRALVVTEPAEGDAPPAPPVPPAPPAPSSTPEPAPAPRRFVWGVLGGGA